MKKWKPKHVDVGLHNACYDRIAELESAIADALEWLDGPVTSSDKYMIIYALKKALKEEKDKCTHAVATKKPNMTNPVCRLCGEPVLGNKEE